MAIKFSDPKLYLKGTALAYLQDSNGNIVYYSDKFTAAQVSTSVSDGMIRAGIGTPIAAMIPSDASMSVNFTAADFSLFVKGAQLGANITMGAPVMVCQSVTAAATGSTLQLDVSGGAPVAPIGASDAIAFVQTVGSDSLVRTDGIAYPVTSAGVVSGLAVTAGTQYKVTYYVTRANAQLITVSSLFDPSVYRFTAQFAVYSNRGSSGANQGTHVGNLWLVIPSLKFDGANGGIDGSQTANDTSMISGQALAYDELAVTSDCDDCSGVGNPYAYYIYVPCDVAAGIEGVLIDLDGVIEMETSSSYQVAPMLIVNGDLVRGIDPGSFTYELSPDTAATTVSASGLLTSGATAEDVELTASYVSGGSTFSSTTNVSVSAAG